MGKKWPERDGLRGGPRRQPLANVGAADGRTARRNLRGGSSATASPTLMAEKQEIRI